MLLRPFQKRFLHNATRPGIDTAALSLPRGNGKSALAGYLAARVMNPDDSLFRPSTESVLCAASLEQARIVYRFARGDLEARGGYRFLDSNTRIGITHVATNTKLRVIGSNARTAFGLVNCPWVIADEPGAWEVKGGELLHDAIETAKGKPGSPLRVVYIGTLAPATTGWWHDLVDDGSRGSTFVMALRGDRKKWHKWSEIRRCNPLTAISADFRKKLLSERDDARKKPRLRARFLSYRLNVPSADESTLLLTVDEWESVTARPLGAADGRPIVGLDLGGGRAWSSGVAVWPSGRVEAFAVTPGTPGIADQEKRDRVARGTYQRLVDRGVLLTDGALRVPRVSTVLDRALRWRPRYIVCDRFRLDDLRDAGRGLVRIVPRVVRWSEADADIRGLRRWALDGPLSVERDSAKLIEASIAVAVVKSDDQGSQRLVKNGTANTARDDVAAALLLAAGAASREKPARRLYLGKTA